MTTEEQALALLEEANPVPDLDSYGSNLVATDYLTDLEQGAQKMIDTDVRQNDETEKNTSRTWMAAAAAVVILMVGFAVVPSLLETEPATEPAIPATSVPVAQSGVLTMQLGELLISTDLDECPLDLLRNGEVFDVQPEGTDQTGQEWELIVVVNGVDPGWSNPLPGAYKFEAWIPDTEQHYRAHGPGAPLNETIGETSATYSAPVYERFVSEDPQFDVIVTIDCGA